MCGIAGFNWRNEHLIQAVSSALAHRGPDQSGNYSDDSVSLGHRRLSIIDLSEHGRQPMSNEDGTVWVACNGEIYNFQELRDELEAKGHIFRSRTDTEVIVHAYEEYGPECVQRLNGMFAFALWDRSRRELFLARDRLGIKPLYYYHKGGKFVFASEVKAILRVPDVDREIDPQALYHYMGYEYVPGPHTILSHVYKVPPGHYLRYRNGEIDKVQYWDVHFESGRRPRAHYEERLRELLTDAVRRHLVSDVPLGAFLSGGLDSSAVVALMSRCGVEPIRTFSLGYDDPSFSELEYARIVSRQFKTQHEVLMIDPITPDIIEDAIWHLDEPMSELSAIPTYLMAQKARERVKVCLSGEGGDEVLVGYDRFRASKANAYYRTLPQWVRHGIVGRWAKALPDRPEKKGTINVLKRFVEGGLLPEEGEHLRWQFFGSPERDRQLFKKDFLSRIALDPFAPIRDAIAPCNATERLDREVYLELKLIMPEIANLKVDKTTMAHGLEIRVPFLDHQFVEFCATIPGDMKLRGFTTKSIFRSAMKDILPDTILKRGKQGYSLPLKNWLRVQMRDYAQEVIASSELIQEVFDLSYIQRMVREHLDYRANHSHTIWALVNLAVWHRLFIESQWQPNRSQASQEPRSCFPDSLPAAST
jgi:asparagine synthase (glutamine-hydrolysing)